VLRRVPPSRALFPTPSGDVPLAGGMARAQNAGREPATRDERHPAVRRHVGAGGVGRRRWSRAGRVRRGAGGGPGLDRAPVPGVAGDGLGHPGARAGATAPRAPVRLVGPGRRSGPCRGRTRRCGGAVEPVVRMGGVVVDRGRGPGARRRPAAVSDRADRPGLVVVPRRVDGRRHRRGGGRRRRGAARPGARSVHVFRRLGYRAASSSRWVSWCS
jgi:hypothetical protein